MSSLHAAEVGAALLTRVTVALLGEIATDNITRNAADALAALLIRRDADRAEGAAAMSIWNAANACATVGDTRFAEACGVLRA